MSKKVKKPAKAKKSLGKQVSRPVNKKVRARKEVEAKLPNMPEPPKEMLEIKEDGTVVIGDELDNLKDVLNKLTSHWEHNVGVNRADVEVNDEHIVYMEAPKSTEEHKRLLRNIKETEIWKLTEPDYKSQGFEKALQQQGTEPGSQSFSTASKKMLGHIKTRKGWRNESEVDGQPGREPKLSWFDRAINFIFGS